MRKNKSQAREEDDADDMLSLKREQREISAKCALESFKRIMDTSSKMKEAAKDRPKWKSNKNDGEPPSEMTVTHINQTAELIRPEAIDAVSAKYQKSAVWLKSHSIEHMKLTLKDLVAKGKILRPGTNKVTGKVQQHLQFNSTDIMEFECKLNGVIQLYTARIKWFLQGSRKTFGMIKGKNVAVLIDSSDANFGFSRRSGFIDSLMHLIDEQLIHRKKLYLASFGSDICSLWEEAKMVNSSRIEDAKEWVNNLQSRGGTNIMGALRHAFQLNGINTICLFVGSVPDQDVNILCDYAEQLNLGRNIELHTVSYDCSDHITNAALKRLADMSNSSYHCSNCMLDELLYTSTEINLLLLEIRRCQDVLDKIKDMRAGQLGTALVDVMDEISKEVARLPPSRFLPRPPGHDLPLTIEMPSFSPSTSAQWLAKHGLKAKSLDLYQVLAPNAFSYREGFIPVIRKTVQSQVHSKAMAQFQWHDGTMKNVHVDMSMLFEYQKQLGSTVKLYEKRIDWLLTSSRRIFGTVTENNVLLLLDISLANTKYIIHIQNSLRLLLEQQMANKEYFNIISCGEEVKMWKPTMVKPTGDMLQQAWRWLLNLQCNGSRNIMDGLRKALENDEESKHNIEVEGIYVFISGVPDQSADLLFSYLEEKCSGRNLKLHVVLFNIDDYDVNGAIPGRYANITKTAETLRNLSHCTGGRFHWFRETGVIESDDISCLSLEIEKALNFSKKCAMLVDSVKQKFSLDQKYMERDAIENSADVPLPPGTTLRALPPPKSTALSQARKELAFDKDKDAIIPKALAYKDGQVYRPAPAKQSDAGPGRPQSAKDPMMKVKTGKKSVQAFFYTGNKNDVGTVYKKYPPGKPPHKGISLVTITDKEDQISTKDWLRMYSLSKMRLNLDKLAVGSECHHVRDRVKILDKTVDAKMCNIFPTVNVAGSLRHLLLSPKELREFEQQVEHVLTRYLRRLQWVLGGSRQIFGTVCEKKCIFLIDTSGSMDQEMDELKKELTLLIWEQIYKFKICFNLIRFSKDTEKWQPSLVEPTDSNCKDAAQWVSQLVANGNTCTLEALQTAFQVPDLEAIYLLTDGKPDTSTALVQQEVLQMNANSKITINTISFNCTDSIANNFLQMLARENRGRYHRVQKGFDVHLFAHQLIEGGFQDPEYPVMPELEGDDIKRLGQEIQKARHYLSQSRIYRSMYESLKKSNESPTVPHDCKQLLIHFELKNKLGFSVGPGSKQRPMSAKP